MHSRFFLIAKPNRWMFCSYSIISVRQDVKLLKVSRHSIISAESGIKLSDVPHLFDSLAT
jgi:hypothetical protein